MFKLIHALTLKHSTRAEKVRLRGKWVDHSSLAACGASRDEARLLNHYNQINAAHLIGYTPDQVLESAHVH